MFGLFSLGHKTTEKKLANLLLGTKSKDFLDHFERVTEPHKTIKWAIYR